MRTMCLTLAALLISVVSALAQVVTGPTTLQFAHPDGDFLRTAAYKVEYFQCTSVTMNGTTPVCNGKATQPFQTGVDVPKSAVSGGATARVLSLTTQPANGPIQAMPAGVGFIATLVAVADPNAGATSNSARSGDSNPFFGAGLSLASPTSLQIR